jgi:shikimate dehydrogenase
VKTGTEFQFVKTRDRLDPQVTMGAATHITGRTRLYGLIGNPIEAAKSPELLNDLFVAQGVNAVCIPFPVQPDALPAFVQGARALGNLDGLLVTMPYKQRMLAFVDELHPTSRQVGALNIVRCHADGRWVGAMFDGMGCVLAMQWESNDPANRSVLLVGAGGAGRAIAFAIAAAGARALTIFDVDERRATDLAASIASTAPGCVTRFGPPDPRGQDIVVNATPLGMNSGDPMPVDPDRLDAGTVVVDVVSEPDPTPLCRAARSRGCRTQGGRPMHQGQAVHALRFLGFDYLPEGRPAPPIPLSRRDAPCALEQRALLR